MAAQGLRFQPGASGCEGLQSPGWTSPHRPPSSSRGRGLSSRHPGPLGLDHFAHGLPKLLALRNAQINAAEENGNAPELDAVEIPYVFLGTQESCGPSGLRSSFQVIRIALRIVVVVTVICCADDLHPPSLQVIIKRSGISNPAKGKKLLGPPGERRPAGKTLEVCADAIQLRLSMENRGCGVTPYNRLNGRRMLAARDNDDVRARQRRLWLPKAAGGQQEAAVEHKPLYAVSLKHQTLRVAVGPDSESRLPAESLAQHGGLITLQFAALPGWASAAITAGQDANRLAFRDESLGDP